MTVSEWRSEDSPDAGGISSLVGAAPSSAPPSSGRRSDADAGEAVESRGVTLELEKSLALQKYARAKGDFELLAEASRRRYRALIQLYGPRINFPASGEVRPSISGRGLRRR